MAVYPCDRGMHRYAGPQRSVYLTHVNSSRPETEKQRLCERHYAEFKEICDDLLDLLDEDQETSTPMFCQWPVCEAPRKSGVFVKLYPGGDDYVQFAGDFCATHVDMVLAQLRWIALKGPS